MTLIIDDQFAVKLICISLICNINFALIRHKRRVIGGSVKVKKILVARRLNRPPDMVVSKLWDVGFGDTYSSAVLINRFLDAVICLDSDSSPRRVNTKVLDVSKLSMSSV